MYSRMLLLLAIAPMAAAAAPQDCPDGPSLPFYAYAVRGGEQLGVYRGPGHPNYYATFGLVNLDESDYVLMENAGTLRVSRDRGCTFEDVAPVEHTPLWLVAAPGGGAYGFALNAQGFYEIVPDGSTFVVTPQRPPVGAIIGVGVDPADARHVYIGDSSGQIHHSTDGGANWSRLGFPPAIGAFGYRFAFDPHDPAHAIFGALSFGGWVTFDSGTTWTPMAGLSETNGPVNTFNAVFSPVDGDIAWVMALDIDQADAGDPSNGRHFYLSTDAGRSFTPVVDESAEITITNGPEITPHPQRWERFGWVFGSSFSGLDIYQYDAEVGAVKKRHFDGLLARSLVYATVDPRNMLIGLEGGLLPLTDARR